MSYLPSMNQHLIVWSSLVAISSRPGSPSVYSTSQPFSMANALSASALASVLDPTERVPALVLVGVLGAFGSLGFLDTASRAALILAFLPFTSLAALPLA